VAEGTDSEPTPRREPSDGSYEIVVEQSLKATPDAIYRAWTHDFDSWFASPGALKMVAKVGEPYWFEVNFNDDRHPHHGRIIHLEPGHLIAMTWVTGKNGTWGAETLVTVALAPDGDGTKVRLTHGGFYDEPAARQHAESWPGVLAHLDEVLAP
jgi:uncharacterized protein YndB with AHSA1/START domain